MSQQSKIARFKSKILCPGEILNGNLKILANNRIKTTNESQAISTFIERFEDSNNLLKF